MPLIYDPRRETDDGWRFYRVDISARNLQYTLQMGFECLAVCVGCWNEAESQDAWNHAEQLYLELGEMAPDLDLKWTDVSPPPTPWLYALWLPATKEFSRKERTRLKKIEVATFFAFMDMCLKK